MNIFIRFMVHGPAFECSENCERTVRTGDIAYLFDGRMICGPCADRHEKAYGPGGLGLQ